MALSNIGGGRQDGDGNTAEVVLLAQGAPVTATATATLTVAQLTGKLIVADPSTSAASYTLPTAATLDAALVNAHTDSAFEVNIVNLGTSSGAITIVTNTGWTLVGAVVIAIGTTGNFRARKLAATNTWVLYRV